RSSAPTGSCSAWACRWARPLRRSARSCPAIRRSSTSRASPRLRSAVSRAEGPVNPGRPARAPLRIGVWGVGTWGEKHARVLHSLDIDVVFDLMIHVIDIVLNCVGTVPDSISAVGVAVLSENEDIANARLEFADGCVANLTASRVSQERLRRIRFFQSDTYLSVDLFAREADLLRVDAARLRDSRSDPVAAAAAIRRGKVEVGEGEPLALELAAFLRSLRGEGAGAAPAEAGRDALR